MKKTIINCDLLIIGTGMAGMAASVFAANRGLSAVNAGQSGEINFASGFLDLMGVFPVQDKKQWENPWEAVDALVKEMPEHPYAKISGKEISLAFDEFTDFLYQSGVPYAGYPDKNIQMLTPVGTFKPTFRVPNSMFKGIQAYKEKNQCLIADFRGMKGFSGRQLVEVLGDKWPGLRNIRIDLPGLKGEAYPKHLARSMENMETRQSLIKLLKPHIKEEKSVGFPAIMGLCKTLEVISHLEQELGVEVFEIAVMPPSVAGSRIWTAYQTGILKKGVNVLFQKQVLSFEQSETGELIFDIGQREKELRVQAKGAVLASGRFFGKGLYADRKMIRESIFNLPVFQPESRCRWHENNFLSPKGHKLNQAGIETDEFFRPLDSSGRPAYKNLFAAGSILAHQDWTRMKCGSGLAIASAFKAVNSFIQELP
ncbi:Anaerobic glycerol-3-phosphate dehydrogenase, subunit B [Desulfonema limicola]|uniref:Anaerobic glycerol-3-phosphate dehydrogenase, subunit B n=1 Tax=Desulfonema limicola TaxID=45656 RepID=A0A975B8Z4_9BACT|nr:glycerol-3-phosphate dehydrogenase subunit GlpB [Desulfonema limicola]QTA80933.1 Anaerobic glycerol-3-phosphate dehydrogenase, subunit B [Desulfonema limicola]